MSTNATILLIDKEPANILLLEKLLDNPGWSFLNAHSGKDALRKAMENEVDLIVLDIQMPEMSGGDLAQILKSNKETTNVPIIFTSTDEEGKYESVITEMEEDMVGYLL